MRKFQRLLHPALLLLLLTACQQGSQVAEANLTEPTATQAMQEITPTDNGSYALATFGSGCFWCTEAVFQRLNGVIKVTSGYSGGHVENPTYKAVCTGTTGHAEVIQVQYDPAIVTYEALLEVFWKMHDPTTLNRQGADEGTQYRSVIFYHDEEQQRLAESYKKKLEAAQIWDKPIVTEITAYLKFYPAEAYHQNYYNQNSGQSYCAFVITPKLEKFRSVFRDKMKAGVE